MKSSWRQKPTRRRRKRKPLRRLLAASSRPRAIAALAAVLAAVALALFLWPEPARRAVRRALEPASLARVESFAPHIRASARDHGIDPCLVAGIIYAESRGKVDAVSSAGALGLMQLVPAAASDAADALGLPPPSEEALLSDAELNIRLGTRHFAWTLRNEEDDPERALCAYNAGRGRLAEWLREAGGWRKWRAKQMREGDSQVLAYAHAVLDQAEEFRRRGVIEGGRVEE